MPRVPLTSEKALDRSRHTTPQCTSTMGADKVDSHSVGVPDRAAATRDVATTKQDMPQEVVAPL
jgi:hypothetical protein